MDIYIFDDSFDLENLTLWNIELTLILLFCFLEDLLKLCFLTRCLSIFTTIDEKKEEQKSTYQIFLKDVTEEKKLEIHKQSWLSMVWIFKKLNSFKWNYNIHKLPSKQNYLLSKTYKKSHSITQAVITLNKFVFHPNNYLVPLQIWVIKSQL